MITAVDSAMDIANSFYYYMRYNHTAIEMVNSFNYFMR